MHTELGLTCVKIIMFFIFFMYNINNTYIFFIYNTNIYIYIYPHVKSYIKMYVYTYRITGFFCTHYKAQNVNIHGFSVNITFIFRKRKEKITETGCIFYKNI